MQKDRWPPVITISVNYLYFCVVYSSKKMRRLLCEVLFIPNQRDDSWPRQEQFDRQEEDKRFIFCYCTDKIPRNKNEKTLAIFLLEN